MKQPFFNLLAALLLLAASLAQGQVPTPLVDLNAEGLAAGAVNSWSNDGSLGGTFNAIVAPQNIFSWSGNPPTAETVDGRPAVTFNNNGMEASVSTPASVTGATPVFTVVFQVYNPDYTAGAGGVEVALEWGARANAEWAGFGIGNNSWGAASFFGGGHDFSYGGTPPATGAWQVVFITVDGAAASNQVTVYVENAQVNQGTVGGNPLNINTAPTFAFGGTRDAGTNRNTTASYARLQIYDTVLTADQRNELYDLLVNGEPSITDGKTVAFIVNSPTNLAGRGFDQMINDRLTSLGMIVTTIDDNDVGGGTFTAALAETYDLLLISESCSSSNLNNFAIPNVPTMHNEYIAWNNSANLGDPAAPDANAVWQNNQTQIAVENIDHAILSAAGVTSGTTVTVYTQPTRLASRLTADLAPSTEILATASGAPTFAHMWTIEKGEALWDGTPAQQRIATYPLSGESSSTAADGGGPRTLADLTPEGLALFDQTIIWLLTTPAAPNAVDPGTWTLY